jgi:hypothetical protein
MGSQKCLVTMCHGERSEASVAISVHLVTSLVVSENVSR